MAKTVAERAAELGISRATAYNWKGLGVDIFSDEAVRLHRSQRRTDGGEKPASPQGDPEMRAARLRKLTAEADRGELSYATLKGDYLPRAEVAASEFTIGQTISMLLRSALSELPGLMAGLPPAEIEKKLKPWVCDWADKLRDAQSDVWKRAREATLKDLRGDARRAAKKLAADAAKQRAG